MSSPTHLTRVTEKTARGKLSTGAIVNSTDPVVTEVLATCGYDFIWIDT